MPQYNNLYSINDLILYNVGKQRCAPGHQFHYVFKHRYLLHFVLSGKGTVMYTDGSVYQVSAGSAFFIGAKEGIYKADLEEPWTYIWVHITGEELLDLFARIGLNAESPIYTSADPEKIACCCEALFLRFYHQEHIFSVMHSLFSLLNTMVETSIHKKDNGVSNENPYIVRCRQYIFSHYDRVITTRDLSQSVGIEYSYLFRLFKANLGVAPILYVINYKMLKACELITNQASVAETARKVGYENQLHFSKMFKKYIGVSPQQYKKGALNPINHEVGK